MDFPLLVVLQGSWPGHGELVRQGSAHKISFATPHELEGVRLLGLNHGLSWKELAPSGRRLVLVLLEENDNNGKLVSIIRELKGKVITTHLLAPTWGDLADVLCEPDDLLPILEGLGAAAPSPPWRREIESLLPEICDIVRKHSGVEFGHYRRGFLVRRVAHRMGLLGINNPDEYVELLRSGKGEELRLKDEFLISVTHFFRDPEAFEALRQRLRPLLEQRRALRIWSVGCASGEEPYSLAMLLTEEAESLHLETADIKIIATDLDEEGLELARAGRYSLDIKEYVSQERLGRFFVAEGEGYAVAQKLRRCCQFSSHNLVADPPFTDLDAVVCRNVMIYLGTPIQEKLLPVFHYALRPGGFLLVGSADKVGPNSALYSLLNDRARLYQRIEGGDTAGWLPSEVGLQLPALGPPSTLDFGEVVSRILASEFSPRAVIINEDGRVLWTSGDVGHLLSFSPGAFKNQIVQLARKGLRNPLRSALLEARRLRRTTVRAGVRIEARKKQGPVMLDLTVQPMPELGSHAALFLVVFQERPLLGHQLQTPDESSRILELEREVARLGEELDRTTQEVEAATEELKSSNEELTAMNEELRISNEELQKTRAYVERKNEELNRSNLDLTQLLTSIDVPTLFLDFEGRLLRYTPSALRIYPLTPGDIGRPLRDIRDFALSMPPPTPAVECEIELQDGSYFLRKVLPYADSEGKPLGVVLTFTDVSELRRSQTRLDHSLRELSAIYDQAPVGLGVADGHLHFRKSNRFFRELLGADTAQTVLPEILSKAARQVLDSGRACSHQEFTLVKDGETLECQASIFPLRDPSGAVEAINVVVQEVGYLKRREKELNSVLDNVSLGYVSLDHKGYYLHINRTVEKLIGLPLEAVVGHHVSEFFPDWERSEFFPAFEKALGGEEVLITARFPSLQRDYTSRYVPSLAGVTIFYEDITERTQAERELRNGREQFRTLLNSTAEAIFGIDVEGRCTFANQSCFRSLGYASHKELLGRKVHELFHHSHPDGTPYPVAECALCASFGTDQPFHRQDHFVRRDGTFFPVECWAHPLTLDGQVVGSVVTFMDISERLLAARELSEAKAAAEAASRAKSEFLANMSHEIRTPMAAILGYVDILLRQINDPDNVDCLHVIQRNCNHLLEIINDILDLSKIEAGSLQVELLPVSIPAVLTEVLSLLEVSAAEKQLPLEVEYRGLLPETISSDPTRLRQILLNLLGNAIKFTESGHVKLSVALNPMERLVEFTIQDTGVGIAPEVMGVLFRPFIQGDTSVTRRFGGTGLGLAISRQLVKLLGGTIAVESQVQRGTTFRFTVSTGSLDNVQLLEPGRGSEPPRTATSSQTQSLHHKKILVVDDRNDIRFLVRSYLEDAGAVVDTAVDGKAALDYLAAGAASAIDCVVLDMQMPTLDGYATAREIRRRELKIPILALTASAMKGDREACLSVGCNSYLTKPVDRTALVHQVAALSTSRRPLSILIVEDNPMAGVAVKAMLQSLGYHAEVAGGGQQALETARQRPPDCVLIDLGLPDIDGWQLLQLLRALPALRDCRFYAHTGRSEQEVLALGTQGGFDGILQKPVTRDQLIATLFS